jgi:hypothetical protein
MMVTNQSARGPEFAIVKTIQTVTVRKPKKLDRAHKTKLHLVSLVTGPVGVRGPLVQLLVKKVNNKEPGNALVPTELSPSQSAKEKPLKFNLATTAHAHQSVLGPAGARGRVAVPIVKNPVILLDLVRAGAKTVLILARARRKSRCLAKAKNARSSVNGLVGADGESARLHVATKQTQPCTPGLDSVNAQKATLISKRVKTIAPEMLTKLNHVQTLLRVPFATVNGPDGVRGETAAPPAEKPLKNELELADASKKSSTEALLKSTLGKAIAETNLLRRFNLARA